MNDCDITCQVNGHNPTCQTMTVQVRVKSNYGTDTVYPANLAAIYFAEIAGTKTLTAQTMRGIRKLGYAVEVLTGTLPEGF